MKKSINILLISGSIKELSYTRALVETIETHLQKKNITTTHWNLRELPLPIADPRFHSDPSQHPDETVKKFVSLADTADGFVLASPIYHNSYSGVLKNALDHLDIKHFRYKPIGLASHGGHRTSQAVDHLRIVARGLLGVAIPTQVCTDKEDFAKTESGQLEVTNENILERIDRFVSELVVFAECLEPMYKKKSS